MDFRLPRQYQQLIQVYLLRIFFLRNFNVEGFEGSEVLTETVITPALSVNPNETFSTVSNIDV